MIVTRKWCSAIEKTDNGIGARCQREARHDPALGHLAHPDQPNRTGLWWEPSELRPGDDPPELPTEIGGLLDAIRDYTQALIAMSDYTGDGTHEWMVQDRCRTTLGIKLAEILKTPRPTTALSLLGDMEDVAAAEAAKLVAAGRRVRFKLIEQPDGSTTIRAIDAGPKPSVPPRKVWIEGVLSGGAPPCDCDHPHREGAQHSITKVWRQPRHWETCARAVFLAQRAAGRGTLAED